MNHRAIEFWLGFGSTYSYLSVMRIDQAVAGTDIAIDWKPFNIRTLMIEKGLRRTTYCDAKRPGIFASGTRRLRITLKKSTAQNNVRVSIIDAQRVQVR